MQADRIAQLLPEIYRRTVVDGSPIATVIAIMEQLHAPVEETLADVPRIFDPQRTPDRFVPFLAQWVDLARWLDPGADDFDSGLGRLRQVVAGSAQLARTRGTPQGMRDALEWALGVSGVTIDDETTDAAGRRIPFHVVVALPAAAAPYERLARRIVEQEKPAHVTADIVFGDGGGNGGGGGDAGGGDAGAGPESAQPGPTGADASVATGGGAASAGPGGVAAAGPGGVAAAGPGDAGDAGPGGAGPGGAGPGATGFASGPPVAHVAGAPAVAAEPAEPPTLPIEPLAPEPAFPGTERIAVISRADEGARHPQAIDLPTTAAHDVPPREPTPPAPVPAETAQPEPVPAETAQPEPAPPEPAPPVSATEPEPGAIVAPAPTPAGPAAPPAPPPPIIDSAALGPDAPTTPIRRRPPASAPDAAGGAT